MKKNKENASKLWKMIQEAGDWPIPYKELLTEYDSIFSLKE